MRWPWWRGQRPSAPWPAVNPRRQELETAKEILAEVFGAHAPHHRAGGGEGGGGTLGWPEETKIDPLDRLGPSERRQDFEKEIGCYWEEREKNTLEQIR